MYYYLGKTNIGDNTAIWTPSVWVWVPFLIHGEPVIIRIKKRNFVAQLMINPIPYSLKPITNATARG
jgi:hypothetical protein